MHNEFKIGNKVIGKNKEPFIIAEAGINHNGDIELAKRMILCAKKSGVDAIKFQTFKTEEFIKDKSEMYTYQSQGKKVIKSLYHLTSLLLLLFSFKKYYCKTSPELHLPNLYYITYEHYDI